MSADRLPAWGEKEIGRFSYRVGLFTRRGMGRPQAENLADRLYERDFERDDRRVCVECNGLQRGMTCANSRPGQPKNAPLLDVLQRCPDFKFQVPA